MNSILTLSRRWLVPLLALLAAQAAAARTIYYFNELARPGLIPSELLYTYQGVVNRSGPKIFIISDLYEHNWVSWTASQFGDTFVEVTDPWTLLSNPALNQYCKSFVLYNSASCKLAANAAATQASFYSNACIVDMRDGGTAYRKIKGLPYAFTCVEDMSAYWTGAGAEVACENWQLNRQLTNNVLSRSWFCLKQGNMDGYPGTPKGLDFCMSERMMVFMADAGNIWGLSNYAACEEKFVAYYPPLTTAFGWWVDNAATTQQEDISVREVLSSHGHGFYGHGFNCSFFKWYGVPQGQTMTQYERPLSVTNFSSTNKYVVLSMSQGDNSGWLTKIDTGYVTATSANPAFAGVPIFKRYPFGMFCDTAQVTRISPWPLWKLYQITWGYDVRFMGKGHTYSSLPMLAGKGYLDEWNALTDDGMHQAGMTELVAIDSQRLIRDTPSKYPLTQTLLEVTNARCMFFRDDAGFIAGTENDPPTLLSGKWMFADPVKTKKDANGNFSAALTGEAIRTNSRSFFWVFYGVQPITDLEATGDYLVKNCPEVKILGIDQFVKLWLATRAAEEAPWLNSSRTSNSVIVSWPETHKHFWVLQAQTNSVTGAWHTISGSSQTNRIVLPLHGRSESVFYRAKKL